MRKLLARKLKAHSLEGCNTNLAFTHSPPAPFKPWVSGHVTPSANFLQDVAACFSKERTLTTLSKRSLKCLALEGDLQEVLKTCIKTSWREIRERNGVIVTITAAFPFPPPRVCISLLMIIHHTVWLPCLLPWLTKSLIPVDYLSAQGPSTSKRLSVMCSWWMCCSMPRLLAALHLYPFHASHHPSLHPFFTSSLHVYQVATAVLSSIRWEALTPAAIRMSR